MEKYRNLSGESGVTAFETGSDYIRVKFSGSFKVYRYSYHKAGKRHVEKMKTLAIAGKGLSTYISRYVHDLFDE
ncbi:MAG: hypothetical protein K0R65_618 [Crocinitomicaceae bacterium]|jgi:hypothetical protein|nr:hypothetical protein [Crocinitomicaceae bacterium]